MDPGPWFQRLIACVGLMALLLIPASAMGHHGKCPRNRPDHCVTTTTAPTTTTTVPPTTTTTIPVFVPAYPAQPEPGTLYWGATIQGNNYNSPRMLEHEAACSCVVSSHRSFFQWTHRTGYMIDQARGDLLSGRLPWISIKTPEWTEMANGLHNAGIDEMLRALDALPGPIWLTIHHEPEGGGPGGNVPDFPSGPSAWLGMQRKVRERMDLLGTDNIALVPVLMSYTWDTASGRNPEQWWAPDIFDFLGVDHYVHTEAANLLNPVWQKVRDFAEAKAVDVGVGEWGMIGTNAAAGDKVRAWYNAAAGSHNDGNGARVVSLMVFDYDIGGESDDWTLYGEQLIAFRQLLTDPRTALIE